MAESGRAAKVLLTGAGGAAAVSFIKATRDEGYILHAADMDHLGAGLYLVPQDRRHLVLAGADPGFVSHLLALCRRHAIDVLVPTVDFELLGVAKAKRDFEAAGVRLLLASESTLELCLDKLALLRACESAVSVGRFAELDSNFSADGWEFPVMVKPRRGAGSRGIVKVPSLDALARLPRDGDLMVQEFLPGEEYSVDVLAAADGRIVAVVPRSRLKVDSGIAVAGRTLHDAAIEGAASKVAERIGLHFAANVQFKRDRRGIPTLLEVNPRFPGTMPLTVESGVNMPLLALRDALGTPPPAGRMPFRDVGVVRYWAEEFISPTAFDDWPREKA